MALLAKSLLLALAACAASAPLASHSSQAPNTAPLAKNVTDAILNDLALKPTAVTRFQQLLTDGKGNLLSADQIKAQVVFDYNAAKPAPGALGGRSLLANVANFPILKDLDISSATFFLEACGVNTPHVHPRATEVLTVVEGTVDFGMILENNIVTSGTGEITGELTQFQGTVFPQGSIHYQFNPSCDPATFVATLNSDDPGANQVAQGFFGLNGEVVQASLGWPKAFSSQDLDAFRKQIPLSLAARIESCLTKCGLQKTS